MGPETHTVLGNLFQKRIKKITNTKLGTKVNICLELEKKYHKKLQIKKGRQIPQTSQNLEINIVLLLIKCLIY